MEDPRCLKNDGLSPLNTLSSIFAGGDDDGGAWLTRDRIPARITHPAKFRPWGCSGSVHEPGTWREPGRRRNQM